MTTNRISLDDKVEQISDTVVGFYAHIYDMPHCDPQAVGCYSVSNGQLQIDIEDDKVAYFIARGNCNVDVIYLKPDGSYVVKNQRVKAVSVNMQTNVLTITIDYLPH